MAQFTAQGRGKLLGNGQVRPVGLGSIDPLPFKLRSVRLHGRKLRFSGPFAKIHPSSHSSSPSKDRSRNVTSSKPRNVSEESVHVNGDDSYYSDEEFGEEDDLACFRGLVLDLSYRPVNVVCWKRAICLEFMEKADVLEYYDQTVNSPNGSFYIPAVLRVPHLLQVVKRRRVKNSLSRKNILHRDNYTCQYCSTKEKLTIDHVLPISRGGQWTWENLVTACSRCNSRKGQKTLEEANMKLMKVPKAPKDYEILAIPLTTAAIKMLRARQGMPEEWRQYLARSSDL
ncbi:hypothetical protein SAY87_030669 [Trapa incisa]|uniref:HNH nuclease domain-containing protein n=1 Tax=Trapa incisa TaxID=236973 RepID=A0AAN7KW36_9MYRT|nr:hypothetical protein SAY87_030669 [Trapa incisa]